MKYAAFLVLALMVGGCNTIPSNNELPSPKLKPASEESLERCKDLPKIPERSIDEINPQAREMYYEESRIMYRKCQGKHAYLARRDRILTGNK